MLEKENIIVTVNVTLQHDWSKKQQQMTTLSRFKNAPALQGPYF